MAIVDSKNKTPKKIRAIPQTAIIYIIQKIIYF